MPNNTYAKLRSGDWGVRASVPVEPGAVVQVTKQSGEVKDEIIDKVLWRGEGIALCSIRQRPRKHAGGCACTEEGCCRPRCHCEPHCVCRGGNIFDCMG